MQTLQASLHLASNDQLKRAWAFARALHKNKKDSVITACSKEAKALGIRLGMRYEEAKLIVPEIKILVIGGGNV